MATSGTNANAKAVYNSLRSKGYSSHAAAGVVGNLQQESGVNPASNQKGGPGRGIAQWSEGARWETLKKYAAKRKQNPNSLTTQTNFMVSEMQGLGQGPGSSFAKSTNTNAATLSFEKVFERAGTPNMSSRYTAAGNAYRAFSGNTVSSAKPYSVIPGITAGPKLSPKSTPAPKAVPGKAGKKSSGGIDWAGIGDNLVPDNLNKVGDAITPDNLPNPVTGLEAAGKITTQLFSVSFWIRAAFIIMGAALVFIGTKALLSGSAPTPSSMPNAPTMATPAPSKARKPFGKGIGSDVGEVAAA